MDVDEKSTIEARYTRYCELTTALSARELELRSDSVLCRGYILRGEGAVDDIVDTMEEMNFLFTYTSYASECRSIIPERYWSDSDDYWSDKYEDYDDYGFNSGVRARKEEIKRRIKDQYLLSAKGLKLPGKRQRELETRAVARQGS